MNFVDISTLNIEIELDVLKRDTQRNSFFLYQHKGIFFADNTRIGNNNQEEAITKFRNVLGKAKDDNIALVLSPEYSCPKNIIDEIIQNEAMRPPQGKIWVLGGESLNKIELSAIRGINDNNVYIYFEDCYTNSDKNYVDPLYYIFRGIHEGTQKLIILIQFKSRHMGGLRSSQLEAENLIEGENVYIIKNNPNSIRLMSFICSQAINFDATYRDELVNNHSWTDSPFLVLSLQYNPNPSHTDFIAFKRFVLEREKRELITLNWGIETTFTNGNNLYNDTNTPRSSIYFKTTDEDLDFRTVNIENNHKKGLYFLQILRTKRVYFLNGNVELFKIHNKAVSVDDGQDVQQRREGPIIGNIFTFAEDLNLLEINQIDDNHINLLIERGIQNTFLLDTTKSIVDKERLINISTGKVKSKVKDKWSEVIHLNSFILNESDECNNRLTYVEDRYPSSEQVRMLNCSNIFELDQNIIPNTSLYPHSIKHLENKNISLAYADNAQAFNYKYNLINENKTLEKATICYVGAAVSSRDINKVYDELQHLFDEESPGKYTVVVFYKQGNNILNKSNPEAGSITETPNNHNSIT
ncbi:hypothetical protein CMT25_06655 [Elizabethkingia anophelis]|uniref:hypothetical protein n=1 Tax=Elizabethkingia anophelis TaxID=1117645 RepID=UPI000999F23F|nr:hypothetical protein [Elizabethkingia anophelis]MDV4129821.1 hypothetical protein [Elizabethkingia anophelis]MDV4133509.1 hypothetical protein [Elizabethkingia anophelis]OPC55958.1 hypothetical protein BAY08_04150 [Elizabethkingia anophelis]